MADVKAKTSRQGVRAYVTKTVGSIDVIIAKFDPQPGGAGAQPGLLQ